MFFFSSKSLLVDFMCISSFAILSSACVPHFFQMYLFTSNHVVFSFVFLGVRGHVALYVCDSRLQQHLAMSLQFRVFVLQMTLKLLMEISESFGSKDQISFRTDCSPF